MSETEPSKDDAEPVDDKTARPADAKPHRRPRPVAAREAEPEEEDGADDAEDEPAAAAPAKKVAKLKLPVWALVLIGLALGGVLIVGVRFAQELRDRPGHGVTMSSKPSQTRKPWIDDGYIELVPPIRMPSNLSGKDRIEVWLKVPEGKKLSAKYVETQKRWTLVYPPGTIADRLEMPDGEHIFDVRGTEIEPDGGQRFHVYRRHNLAMRGYLWKRDDAEQQEEATRVLVSHAHHFENAPPREIDSLTANNACGPCHALIREVDQTAIKNRPNRGTDSAGFFLPDTTLTDRAPIESHRPREMNVADPLIKFHCFAADGSESDVVWTERQNHTRWPTCADQRVPIGVVDVPAGMKSGDVHVVRLCKSRKALYGRMDDIAKKAFADAFLACNISG